MINSKLEKLMKFVGEGFGRHDYSLPVTVNEWTYATNTKVAVRCKAIILDKQSTSPPPVANLKQWELFPLSADADTKSDVTEPPKQKCEECNGEPLVGCPECDGSGEFAEVGSYSNHEYSWECDFCYGSGRVPESKYNTKNAVRFKCESCTDGFFYENTICELNGTNFMQKELWRIFSTLGQFRYIISDKILLFETDEFQGMLASCCV